VLFKHTEYIDQAHQIVLIIGQWLLNRLADRLVGRKMNDAFKVVLLKELIECCCIANIDAV
jgi:hypothetical protein